MFFQVMRSRRVGYRSGKRPPVGLILLAAATASLALPFVAFVLTAALS